MIGKFLVNLFLTDSEREELLKLHDTLYEIDYDTVEQMEQGVTWARIISRLIFGKTVEKTGDHVYPVMLRKKNESTD